jgi:murein DD-endopeptidase MepM/ murein hydrolase activator NlpD
MLATDTSLRRRSLGPAAMAAALAVAVVFLAGCETPGQGVTLSRKGAQQPEPVYFPPPVARPYTSQETAKSYRLSEPERRSPVRGPRPSEYVVRPGEDLYAIAAAYGIDAYALATLNGLAPPFAVSAGQRLALPPAGDQASPPSPPAAQPNGPPSIAATPVRPDDDQAHAHWAAPPPRAGGEAPVVDEAGFIWPVNGDVISEFGAKGSGLVNDGINIAAMRGTPVRAAEGGVVAYAGNELRGFGNMLLIKHADGWVTAYAHTEELLVNRGERVGKGQVIARVGSTGSVSRPQLHFEMRQGKKPVDPLQYLRRPNA